MKFLKKKQIAITSSLSTVGKNNTLYICAINITEHPITINSRTEVGRFSILSTEQADQLIQIDPQLITLAKSRNKDDYFAELNQLIQDFTRHKPGKTRRPPPEYSKLWFPTPETCEDPSNLPLLEQEIYDQILSFQKLEQVDPRSNEEDRKFFLSKFKWENSPLNQKQIEECEHLLIEYCDIFAKHRQIFAKFDVGYNTELKIKLTPEHDLPVYVQGPPTPIHLRDELHIELALMHYYGLITTLSQSKYSSPLFAHRKESGKLRILIDLRRVNHLLKNDYHSTNFPISNMADATSHFAGKLVILFTKLDCSQAYHCVQMADDTSVQLLAFNFSSRTYAYKCLAQGLSKSVTGFSSFIRHYLDPCLAAGICTQFMDDIGSAVTEFSQLLPSLRKIFDCVRRSGLKLSPEKCEIASQSIKFLGSTFTNEGISPQAEKIRKFLKKITMPRTTKQVKRLIGFAQFFRNFIPNLGEKLISFYQLLRKGADFEAKETHYNALETVKKDLLEATEMTLRLPKHGLQYVLLCDASYSGAGFVLMVEDYVTGKQSKEKKSMLPYLLDHNSSQQHS